MPKRGPVGIELLADPTRRRIIGLIALHPRRPSGIAREIALSRPATTRQLHLLRDAGLLRMTYSPHDGRARICVVNPSMLGPIAAWLAGVEVGRPTGLIVTDKGDDHL